MFGNLGRQSAMLFVLALGICLDVARAQAAAPGADPSPAQLEQFEKHVRPLLVQHCHRCHGAAAEPKGGLRLLTRADLLQGGDSGPAVVPGKPAESLLIEAIQYGPDSYQMPPSGKLSAEQIALLTEWVATGAAWPAEAAPLVVHDEKPAFDLQQRAAHWCWQPVAEVAIPAVVDEAWPRTPIDRFLLAQLEAADLTPAAAADRTTLIRRLSFDLIGLPPTPAEVAAFVADEAPDAYEQLVERLLASPHYGERWARHWLDLVRFAESHGHEFDYDIENAWQYRDYVIRALNADLPYDQFVIEHVAGDLVEPPRRHPVEGFNESIIGTGFFHFGDATHSPVDIRGDEADRLDNQLDVLCKAFLGLTVTCARCHDHKFDAISTKDYYALLGFLRSSRYQQAYLDAPQLNAAPIAELVELQQQSAPLVAQAVQAKVRSAIDRLPKLLTAAREVLVDAVGSPEERTAQAAERHGLDAGTLLAWVVHLQTAAQQPADPWHPWGVLALDANLESPEQFAASCHALAARLATLGKSPGTPLATFAGADYGEWHATGDAFGSGPSQGGELLLGQPVVQVLAPGMAHSGRAARQLHGVLRSPSFTIEHPQLAYRVAGRGTIRLVVDSHRIIFGPLHGGLNLKVESGERLQWLVQNVGEYLGHRAHLELVDEGDGALALAEVRCCDGDTPVDAANPIIVALLEKSHLHSAADLATEYQALFAQVVADGFSSAPEAAGSRDLLNWMFEHTPLFPPDGAVTDERAPVAVVTTQLESLTAQLRPSRRAPALVDGSGEDVAVHIRGSHKQLGEVVPRRFLEALGGLEQPIVAAGSGRMELARQMTSPSNPLLARVLVNRLWLHHFGEGLVASPDDFGYMGQPPTHPELLDYLAGELIRSGWSIKHMHRLMVGSAVYRMSSRPSADSLSVDPQNKLLQHMRVRRLEAEAVRDAVLAVSGTLDRRLFGPSVPVYLTSYMVGRGRPAKSGPLDGAARRSLYLSVRRNFMTPLLMAFDFPQPSTTVGRRNVSNVPAQGLALMNDPFVIEQAAHWGESEAGDNPESFAPRIADLYRQAFGRKPVAAELAAAGEFVAAQQARYQAAEPAAAAQRRAWIDLRHALLSTKEFLFVE